MHKAIPVYVGLGYLGIDKFHADSKIPRKGSKPHPLNDKNKAYNKRLARKRVVVVHIYAEIKTFKIMSYP
jgi:hypothetical protein